MLLKKLHFSTLLLVAATIAAILSNILFDFDILQPLELKVYDSMTRLRQRKADTQVVVLAIDDQSIQQLGSWPWPRSYLAKMVKLLSEYGVQTMGISLLYPTREVNPGLQELEYIKEMLNNKPSKSGRKTTTKIDSIFDEAGKRLNHDARLISAVRSARNVVLPLRFTLGSPGDGSSVKLSDWLILNSIEINSVPQAQNALSVDSNRLRGVFNNHRIQASRITEPYHDLSKKAGALGHINLIGDKDGTVRNIPLLITYQDRDFVSFALQVARKYNGGRLKEIMIGQDKIVLRHLQIPTEKNHRMLIDYSGQEANIQQISFVDVIDGKVDAKTFRKQVVLLGVTAEGLSQHYITPTGSNVSGLEIEAAAVENIINAKFISRPSWVFFLEILALLYFGFFLLFVIPRVTPRIGAMILGIFLLTWVGASVILFLSNGIWIKVLAPVILSAIGFALANRRRYMAESQGENVELNKSLGLALQGQGMLDMAYEKFLKCPVGDKAVQKLLYNLGLDFERKRMNNKALSVYRHIMKAGSFKDVNDRIKRLITLDNTMAMTVAAAKREASFLLQNGDTKPTLGRYEILQELGQGAMGIVYLGKDPNINREVAVKTINYVDIAPDELSDIKARFFREAEAAGKLSHPNIVTIYDMGEDHDMAYIAMELLKGKELTHYCQKENLLPLKRVFKMVSAVAEALGYAHSQQVVHRDIKPANILLLDDDQVKVADFGIARVITSSKTQTGIIFGTPNYMSPEQVAGKKVDGRSDLFSLGVVFYELLTGARPFKGDSMTALLYAVSNTEYVPLNEIAPKTPACCVEVVERLLAKGVSKRYQSASQVIKDMQICLDTIN
ncbi:Serine/threonine protein kinase [Olavius sp. associated proteobacterium Delta 1]|nr:Serine/threonine protein kinase [Olavius sp. associated proteobacterium Delta 1]